VQPMADVIPTRTANLSSSSRDLLESLVTKFADARVFNPTLTTGAKIPC